MSVRPPARPGVPRDFLLLAAAAAAVPMLDGVLHQLLAQNPFGAPKTAAAGPQAGGIVGWLLAKQSEFYREMSIDHPRRQIRWLGGLDAARDLLCLRHLPRRRPRPWQGGDLVLSRRQPGDRAARHRAVVRLGADAVAGRGGDCRNLRLAAQRDRQNHVQCRKGDRDRQLRPDRGVRRQAGLDQGRRLYRCAAGAAAGARTGGRRASSRS